ncbi:LysR family transcriptional regulator [Labedaea rhizosphaerae]|uniref:LysR family transcriptional regulator n=1 Tax=Labedaea rhizosphaerae TaxID=598644 RepID=UPI00105CEF45|nr:LysR family transcriptional regulator [Labedaea rhizosphaerae]
MIDPRRLRVLRALADHGTVTAAGQALHLTPSAVSQQLAALESEVGQELLRRRGRRVWLTSAGDLLVKHADAVLAELDRAEATMAAHADGSIGRVRVAAFASAIGQLVAPAAKLLRERHPGITLRITDAEAQQSLPMLLDGEIDLAVTMAYRAGIDEQTRVHTDPLYTEPFVAVLPPGHRLADRSEVAVLELADEPWIGTLPGNPCRDVVVQCCAQAGFTPRIEHASDDFTAEVALVAAGLGVALIPRTALPGAPDVVVHPIAGDAPTRRVFAAVRRGLEDHPRLAAVRSALRDRATELD